jgi:hypothetical protein
MINTMQELHDDYKRLKIDLNKLADEYQGSEYKREEYKAERMYMLETFARKVGKLVESVSDANINSA